MNLLLSNGVLAFTTLIFLSSCASHSHITSQSSSDLASQKETIRSADESRTQMAGLTEPIALRLEPHWKSDLQNTKTLVGVEFLKFSIPIKLSTGETVNGVRLDPEATNTSRFAQYGNIDTHGLFHPSPHFTKWHVKVDLGSSIVLGEYQKGYIQIDRKGPAQFEDEHVVTNSGNLISPRADFMVTGLQRK